MRTIFEIVESAKDNRMPTHEECYFTMLALSYLLDMDHRDLREACMDPKPMKLKLLLQGSFDRYKKALDADPQKWLGPNYTPGSPEHARLRKTAFAVLRKATGIDLQAEKE